MGVGRQYACQWIAVPALGFSNNCLTKINLSATAWPSPHQSQRYNIAPVSQKPWFTHAHTKGQVVSVACGIFPISFMELWNNLFDE